MKRKVLNAVFNFDFIKSLSPQIAIICDKVLDKIDEKFEGKEIEYNIHDFTKELGGDVMMNCFFGKSTENQKIEESDIPIFLSKLMGDMAQQVADIKYTFFGVKYLELGLKQKDREVNRRLKLFKSWGSKFLAQRVEEAQKKIEEGEIG